MADNPRQGKRATKSRKKRPEASTMQAEDRDQPRESGSAAGSFPHSARDSTATDVPSAVEGLSWPALPNQQKLFTLAVLYQLEKSEWWPAERLKEYQFRQLEQLLRHAGETVPFYRDRFRAAGFDAAAPLTSESWQQIPLLTRSDVQENFPSLRSSALPKSHGRTIEVSSSGSTGTPVKVIKSALTHVFWNAFTVRFHLWNGDDLTKKYGSIKTQKTPSVATYPKGASGPAWGSPIVFETGPAVGLNLNAKVHEQAEWLQRTKPNYLLSYPSILEALAKHCLHNGIDLPSIQRVHSMSEVLRPEVRRVCKAAWGVEISDMYSTEETGYIALQCPESRQLLVQAEGAYVEILDERNRSCSPGEVGSVVVTPLHNYAMPLIRYVVGDFAEVGGAAACGRGLQVIERVLGRTRRK